MSATTPNMGLKVWNLLTDSFDHTQLAENFAKIDQHTHAEGKGLKIPTGGIEDGAISSGKIGAEQVTIEKFAASIAESGGLNTASRTYRKFTTTEEVYSSTSTSYTVVDSATVYVPAGARLIVSYMALQKATTSTANIQIFVDEVEIKNLVAGGAPTVQTAASAEVSTFYGPLVTSSAALVATKGITADSSLVTTGMGSSALALTNLVAGNRKVEIKAKAGAGPGQIQIKNRTLQVRSEAYS